MIKFAKKLFPISRSLTGTGVVKTLKLIKKKCPKLKIKTIKSGKRFLTGKFPPNGK